MTDDFKQKLLKYLTGNYEITAGSNTPQFSSASSKINNLQTYLSTQFPDGYFLTGVLQGANASGEKTGFTLVYGFEGDVTFKGFILMLDTDFDVVQLFTEYSSGTDFEIFEILAVGDDGNIYGIENVSGTKRFVLLNNFTVKIPTEANYSVILRKSYTLPANIQSAVSYSNIIKAPGQSYYLFVGYIYDVSYNPQPIVTELKINVGASNTWTEYRYGSTVVYYPMDAFASWDSSGVVTFKIAGIEDVAGGGMPNFAYVEYSKSGSALARTQIGSGVGIPYTIGIVLINLTTSYFAYMVASSPNETNYIFKVNYSNNTLTQIYSKTGPTIEGENISGISLRKDGANIYYMVLLNKTTDYDKYKYYIGRIVDSSTYETYLGEFDYTDAFALNLFYVQNQFNLYIFMIQINNTVHYIYQIYNSEEYNGLPYSDYNSMVPNSANLYDESDIVIFARNLYNRSINNNTTTSIIEIPNNFLNDVTIAKQCLFSENNNEMICNEENITKNIYEVVLMNFINTLIMSNANNPSSIVYTVVGASKINGAISNGTSSDYINARALKFKRIYNDDSYDIVDILPSLINYDGNVATFNIILYFNNGKNIVEGQILSYDESTIYQRIDLSSCENNKYYTIAQDLEVS